MSTPQTFTGAVVTRAAICTNRNSRAIAAQLAGSPANRIDVSYCEDVMPRGAAGCVRDAARFTGGDHFIVTAQFSTSTGYQFSPAPFRIPTEATTATDTIAIGAG